MAERITKNYKLYLPLKDDLPKYYIDGFYNDFVEIK